jgi:O-antigen polymerase
MIYHWQQFRYVYFVGLIVVLTLCTSGFFFYPSLTAYHAYILGTIVIALLAGRLLVVEKQKILKLSLLMMIPVVWLAGCVIDGLMRNDINFMHTYFFVSLLFLISLITLLNIKSFSLRNLYAILVCIGFFEALICVMQKIKIVSSNNSYFEITGTWDNPNVTAMFLSMIIPLSFVCMTYEKRKIFYISFVLQLLIIIVLNCRTAFVGAGLSLVICAIYRYDLRTTVAVHLRSAKAVFLSIAVICIFITTGLVLYHSKQVSADSRLLIWKNTFHLITKSPVKGIGYGNFAQKYNLYQAELVENENTKSARYNNVGPVAMAYNELLQSWTEGGISGLFTLIAAFLTLIVWPVKKGLFSKYKLSGEDNDRQYYVAAYASVASFIIMSMLNFSFQAIPCMTLFIIFTAIIVKFCSPKSDKNVAQPARDLNIQKCFGYVLIVICVVLGFKQVKITYADYLNRQAYILSATGRPELALNILTSLQTELDDYESFWKNYALVLIRLKDYPEALIKLKHAKKHSSDPLLYELSGYSYEKSGNYSNAIDEYQKAIYLEPYKFKSRVAIMRNLLFMKDTVKARKEAEIICNLKPKIMSEKVKAYKLMALNVLKNNTFNVVTIDR